MVNKKAVETNLDLMRFIDASPTAAHAVVEAARRLDEAGFKRIEEGDTWSLEPGTTFYVVRRHRSLVAGRVGQAPPAEAGFRLAGAHTDFPCLRLKPHAPYAQSGYLQLGVEVYGGPLLGTWTNRDLTVAGMLLVRDKNGPPRTALVRSDRALCHVPQLAIHFNREVNDQGLKLDRQKHLPPVLGLGDDKALKREPLLAHLASVAGVKRGDIVGSELEVVDLQAPAIVGIDESLYCAPHIDNNAGCHAVLEALVRGKPQAATQVIALFDSEEVGSETLGGAGSRFLDSVLERLCLDDARPREALHRALSRSILASVDGAHAIHPNYADYHDPRHTCALNGGPVIKVNALQRYATSASSGHWLEHCAARAKVPVQQYIHRTDLRSGSTIGPMTASRLGVLTVDVGNPMLSMHSIRETGGVADQDYMVRTLVEHFGADREPGKKKRPAKGPAARRGKRP